MYQRAGSAKTAEPSTWGTSSGAAHVASIRTRKAHGCVRNAALRTEETPPFVLCVMQQKSARDALYNDMRIMNRRGERK